MKAVEIVEISGNKIQYVQNLLPLNYQENGNEIILAAVEKKENSELAVCGILIVRMNGFSSEVIHIEVARASRREHVATQLLDYFLNLQFRIGEVWPIAISYVDGPNHQEFVAFIENRKDFDIEYDCMIYHIQAEERESSETYQKLRALKDGAELFMELPQHTQNQFRHKMETKGIPYLQNVNFANLEPSLCYCIQKQGEIVAALLIQCESEQELEIVFAYADPDSPLGLAITCASAMKALEKNYQDTMLTIVAAEAKSDTFVRRMFPHCIDKEAIFRAIWNYKGTESEDIYV